MSEDTATGRWAPWKEKGGGWRERGGSDRLHELTVGYKAARPAVGSGADLDPGLQARHAGPSHSRPEVRAPTLRGLAARPPPAPPR